jgi:hypothetical protein
MNEVIQLNRKDSAIAFLEERNVDQDNAVVFEWSEECKSIPYNFLIDVPDKEFQHFQFRTNDNINSYLLINSLCGGNRSFVSIDEKGSREFAFSILLNRLTPKISSQPLCVDNSLTWTENITTAHKPRRIQYALNPIIARLMEFANLKKNWDSYGAKPIKWQTISRVMIFFYKVFYLLEDNKQKTTPVPFVGPFSDGGIQIEWRACYKEFIVFFPEDLKSPIEYLKVDKTNEGEKELQGEALSPDDILAIVENWFLK